MVTAPSADGRFQGQDARETFQFFFRQHWIRMLWPLTRTALLTVLFLGGATWLLAAGGIGDGQSRVFIAAFAGACLLLTQFWFLARFYRYLLNVSVVTDKRAHRIRKSLVSYDEHESIDLWTLQDIRKIQRGPVQTTFGFGTLLLESADMQMRLHFVPRVVERYGDLLRLVEHARNHRHDSSWADAERRPGPLERQRAPDRSPSGARAAPAPAAA